MRVFLVLLVVLASCGPAPVDLVGTYEGMLTATPDPVTATCPAASARTDQVSYKILSGPTLERFGSCSKVALEQTGASAKVKAVSCPADAIYPADMEITGGTLTLADKTLAVSLTYKSGCSVALTGTLTRK